MQMMKNRFLRNSSWIVAGRVFQMALSFVISILSARYLGPSNYGLIGYISAFTSFFTSICTLGLNEIIVKWFIDKPEDEGKFIGTAVLMRLLSSLLSMITILVVVYILNYGDRVTMTVAALQSCSVIFYAFDTIIYWYNSKLQSKKTAIIQSGAYAIVSVYKVFLLVTGKSVEWFAFSHTFDFFLIAVLLLIAYKKDNGKKLEFSWSLGKKMLKQSYHYIISGIMVAVYGYIDKVMIGSMINISAVGQYTVSLQLSTAWAFVLSAIIESSRPIIFKCKTQDSSLYITRIKQLFAAVIWISFIAAILLSFLARPIILILFGEAYLHAVNSLRIASWYTAFSYLGVAMGVWFVGENKQRYIKYLSGCGAIINLLLNFILIPKCGITGAAIATLITQIMANFVIPLLIPSIRTSSLLMIEAFLLKGVIRKRSNGI